MDIIADSITKIKNAISRKYEKVDVIKSGLMEDMLSILKREGYILDFKESPENKYAYTVFLKYVGGKPVISGFKRVSHLSRRVYTKVGVIPRVYNNLGIAIISTSKGVLTDKEARALGVGGEVICFVW